MVRKALARQEQIIEELAAKQSNIVGNKNKDSDDEKMCLSDSKDNSTLSPRVTVVDTSVDKKEHRVKLPLLYKKEEVLLRKVKDNIDKSRRRNNLIRGIYGQCPSFRSRVPWNLQDQKYASMNMLDILSTKENPTYKTLADITATSKTVALLFETSINHSVIKPIFKHITMPIILISSHNNSDELNSYLSELKSDNMKNIYMIPVDEKIDLVGQTVNLSRHLYKAFDVQKSPKIILLNKKGNVLDRDYISTLM